MTDPKFDLNAFYRRIGSFLAYTTETVHIKFDQYTFQFKPKDIFIEGAAKKGDKKIATWNTTRTAPSNHFQAFFESTVSNHNSMDLMESLKLGKDTSALFDRDCHLLTIRTDIGIQIR